MRRLLLVTLVGCSDPAAKPDAGIDTPPDEATASLSITPASWNYGELDLGEIVPPVTTFVIRNVSPAPVDVSAVALGGQHGADFRITESSCTATLAPDDTCSVIVAFDPIGADTRTAQLEVTGNGVASAFLQGTALVREQRVIFKPGSRNFGDIAQDAASEPFTFTLINEAEAATLVPVLVGSDAPSFTIMSTTCSGTIPLHGTCTATVKMQPTLGGEHVAQLQVTAGAETSSAGLRGVSNTPLAMTPYGASLGSMLVGQPETPGSATFTVENTGLTASGTFTVAFDGADASEYSITNNTCTSSLAPAIPTANPPVRGGTCQITVQLAATTRGTKVADLSVKDNTSLDETRSQLTASAYTAMITTSGTFANTASNQTTTKTFNVVNPSGRATGTVSTSISGAAFSIVGNTCTGNTIAPIGSCQIMVRFAPTSAGTKTGTLSVTANPGGSDSQDLTGLGL